MMVVTIVVTGVLYPLAVWAVTSLAFPSQAGGSLVTVNGQVVGSRLIGQGFSSAKYFHPRPSAAGDGYDASASSASNLGPTSKTLISEVQTRVADVVSSDPGAVAGRIPVDMVTASGSGLDPDVSPDNAYLQVGRIAAARGIPEQSVRALVTSHIEGRTFGVLGEPTVNVLELNLALDQLKG
jgi:K+-transporting ATPase ATPase C chain